MKTMGAIEGYCSQCCNAIVAVPSYAIMQGLSILSEKKEEAILANQCNQYDTRG